MTRIVIYGLLICVAAFTAYLYLDNPAERPLSQGVRTTARESQPENILPPGSPEEGRPVEGVPGPVDQKGEATPIVSLPEPASGRGGDRELSQKAPENIYRDLDKPGKEKGTLEDSMEEESSEHFRISFDGYRHGAISRTVLGILEDAYGTVGKEFGYFPSEPLDTVLYTNRDFFDITQAPGWSGGIYDGKIRIPVRGAESNEALLRKVLFHEYTHAAVHSLYERCPLWMNEGLAEYFSKNYTKKIGQIIPLRSLERSFSWLSGQQVQVAYWESYSAVSFLIETHGFYRIKEFLRSLSEGAALDDAFKGSFGSTYGEFVATWGKG